jgi:hypothetical protein
MQSYYSFGGAVTVLCTDMSVRCNFRVARIFGRQCQTRHSFRIFVRAAFRSQAVACTHNEERLFAKIDDF